MNRARLLQRWILVTLIGLSACAGKSCSCISPIKGGYPVDKRHDNAIQVRATASMFQFLDAHGAGLVSQLLPGGNTFNVPPVCGSNKVCCAMPPPMCRIDIEPQKLQLQPTPPDTLHLVLTTQLKTLDKLPVEFSVVLGTAKCLVSLDTTAGTAGHTDIDIVGDLQFSVEANSDLTRVNLNNAAVNNLDQSMLTLESQPGDFLCTIANFGPIKMFVVGQLGSQLAGNLGGIVSSQLCMKCMTKDDCNSFATACTNGQCMEADGKTCVQELGIEGRLDVGSGLASFSPGLKAYTDIIAAAGGYAGVDTGLSLGMLGGAQADPHNACVPRLPPPATPMVKQSQTFFTDVLPDHATPYHLGIGVHRSELDNIGFGLFDGGGLCLDISTKSVSLLSSKTLGLVIPSLQDLVHVDDAPMQLVMRPHQPPTFALGPGTFTTDTNGKTVIAQPLMLVSIPQLAIDFYAFVDDRFVRIMTLTADVTLPVSLEVDGAGKLNPVIGDTSHAFKNVYVTNSDLLAESPQDLAKAFPMLLSVAIGQITGAIGGIALPSIAGLNFHPVAITSTDPDDNGANQFLAIFANLSAAAGPSLFAAETTATLERLELPSTRQFAVDGRGAGRPTAWLRVGSPSAGPIEYSYSVDGGPWSPFSATSLLPVSDELLWMQGRHFVDVRARRVGEAQTLDPTPARVPLLVDTVAPAGTFEIARDEILARARDAVTPASALQIRVSGDDGATFGEWTASDRLRVPPAHARVRVQARDEAGNVGELVQATPAMGCSIGALGAGSDGAGNRGALVLLALAALAMSWRRRKTLPLAVLTLFGGCGGLGKGDFESPSDEIGRYSDVAVDKDGTFHISAYDDTMGDLVYTLVSDPAKNPGWQWVDGVDLSSPVTTKGGYRHGIGDPGPDVGQYTSIKVTRSGQPRIAYFDASGGALKYAAGPHPFTAYAVETGTSDAPVGMYAALSLDGNDVPSIAYVATGISDGMSGFRGELHLAVAKNANPGASDWTISTVDTTPISCAGRCAAGSACVVTAMVNGKANTDPSYSTCVAVDSMPCAATCTMTQACIKGACTAILPAPSAMDLVEGTGLFVQALRDGKGQLELVYYDHDKGSLKLATQSGGAWTATFLDGNSAGVDVGAFASAVLAADGSIHVAYVDEGAHQLRYEHVSGGMPPMMPDVVDDGTRMGDMPHQVGAGANLVLDESGNPRIVYQDQTLSDLELATGAPMWTHSDVAKGIAGFGFYPHQVSARGKRWLVEFVYDRENGSGAPLGSLELAAMSQ